MLRRLLSKLKSVTPTETLTQRPATNTILAEASITNLMSMTGRAILKCRIKSLISICHSSFKRSDSDYIRAEEFKQPIIWANKLRNLKSPRKNSSEKPKIKRRSTLTLISDLKLDLNRRLSSILYASKIMVKPRSIMSKCIKFNWTKSRKDILSCMVSIRSVASYLMI